MDDKKQLPDQTVKQKRHFHIALIKQIVQLSTAGFGLVAALAWNNVIQDFVNTYIKPYLPQGSSLISLLLYAVIITVIAVTVTYQLTMLIEKLEQ
jgi:hypothetical protein